MLYVVRSSIQSASGNVGVDALRHAWRDCAKGSHFNHCSRACVGCSHEVKRVRRPLFFFLANDRRDDYLYLLYCTSRLPPPPSRANIREKKYMSHLPMSLLSSTGVLLHVPKEVSTSSFPERLGIGTLVGTSYMYMYIHTYILYIGENL